MSVSSIVEKVRGLVGDHVVTSAASVLAVGVVVLLVAGIHSPLGVALVVGASVVVAYKIVKK